MSLGNIDTLKDLIYVMARIKFYLYFKRFWAIWRIFGIIYVHKIY